MRRGKHTMDEQRRRNEGTKGRNVRCEWGEIQWKNTEEDQTGARRKRDRKRKEDKTR